MALVQEGVQRAIRRALPLSAPGGLGSAKTVAALARATTALIQACLLRAEAALMSGRCEGGM